MTEHVKARFGLHCVDLYVGKESAVIHCDGATYQTGDPPGMRLIVRETLQRLTKEQLLDILVLMVDSKK